MITVKHRFFRLAGHAVVVLLASTLAPGATFADSSDTVRSDEEALEMSEIRPGVFMHSGVHADIDEHNLGDIANIGFIAGERSVAVIDPGASPAIAGALQASVASLTGLPISHVILTHFHPDHVLGAGAFPDSANFIAHENYPRAVLQRGAFYLNRYSKLLGIDSENLKKPDQLIPVAESIFINLGERLLEVRAYPVSHTDNDLTVHDTVAGVLWASDLVFETRIPSLDGSIVGWMATLDELQERFSGAWVVPGHGKPGALEPLLTRQREYLRTLIEEIRTGLSHNQRLSVAAEQIGQESAANWRLFDLHHRGNVSKAWSELEWE